MLPFSVVGGEPCNRTFSDGLVQNIGAALLRFNNVTVISGESIEQVTSRDLKGRGAGYRLDGGIECSADGLRLAVQLLDANGSQVASEIQDASPLDANAPKARMELAGQLAGRIASPATSLWKSEKVKTDKQIKQNPTDMLKAYHCVLLSYAYYDTFSAEAHRVARDCLEDAVKLVKDDAVAWARLGAMYFEEHKYGHNLRPGREPLNDARDAAQKSIELDPQMADGYYVLALVYYYTEEDFESFHEMAKRAIAKNPYNGWIIGDLGVWTYYSGDWERGKTLIETARAIYSDDPRWLDFPGVLDHYRLGEYRAAKAAAHALELSQNAMVQEVLAATYGQLGEIENAKRKVEAILRSHPEIEANPRAPFLARKIPAELIEALMDGLRKAGLPN
jgi:tetratricopeptide (TPR) repeat protein